MYSPGMDQSGHIARIAPLGSNVAGHRLEPASARSGGHPSFLTGDDVATASEGRRRPVSTGTKIQDERIMVAILPWVFKPGVAVFSRRARLARTLQRIEQS